VPLPMVKSMRNWITRADRVVTNAIWSVAAALLAVVSCLGLYQVLVRFVFNQPSPWSEELIGRLLIWAVGLGIVAGFRQGALVSVDLMLRLSRGRWHRAVRRLILLVTVVFLVLLASLGLDLAWRIRFQTFATLPVSIAWAYLALPVGAFFSILAVAANYLDPVNRELEIQR
jgi:TRAP-type C4-dicarboxylate transport system permease small subunit